MLQMAVIKISTFLYIKIVYVFIGLFARYLILECLFMFNMIFYILATPFHTFGWLALGNRNTPEIGSTKFVLFSIFSAVY